MTAEGRVIGFDIPGLQRYVFAPVRPLDVMGGSRLLERFAREASESARDLGAEEIYCGGGHGVFIVGEARSSGDATSIVASWRRTLSDLTGGAVELAAASVPLVSDFSASRQRLSLALQHERASMLLDEPSRELLPAGIRPSEVCRACGMERATHLDRVGGADEAIGPQCEARRRQGRREGSVVLRDLFDGRHRVSEDAEADEDPDRPPPGSVLAVLYLDADGLGRRFSGLDVDAVRDLSTEVRERGVRAVKAARSITEEQGRKILAPIVGGDDILLFADARLVLSLLRAVLREVGDASRGRADNNGAGLRFSGSVVFADPYTPLRHLFEVARRSMKEAKSLAHRGGVSYLAFRSLLTRRLHPGAEHLFGGPLPTGLAESVGGRESQLETLVEAIVSIADQSQRVGLSRDLLGSASREERRLAVDDRLARLGNTALRRAVDQARRWSAQLDRDESEILLGGLVLAELWEGFSDDALADPARA